MASFVTDNGLAEYTGSIVTANLARFLQWGVGSGQTVASNTLNNTTGTTEARTAGSMTQFTTSTTSDTVRVQGTIVAAGSRAITEVGVFDVVGSGSPPTGGDMIVYGDFSVINLAVNDSISFDVRVQFDQA